MNLEERQEKERQDIAWVLSHELGHAAYHAENPKRGWVEMIVLVVAVGVGVYFLQVYIAHGIFFILGVFAWIGALYLLSPAERRANNFAKKHWVELAQYVCKM